MKKLVKVVAVALMLATLCMNASTAMAAPINGASHASDRARGVFAVIWAAVWHGGTAVWSGGTALWGGGGSGL